MELHVKSCTGSLKMVLGFTNLSYQKEYCSQVINHYLCLVICCDSI
uniref:Uncharacterized protein n=1 Tax=Rhizophora mucronata TaxID=61149 RepID=A0A2P2PG82_RHIMU